MASRKGWFNSDGDKQFHKKGNMKLLLSLVTSGGLKSTDAGYTVAINTRDIFLEDTQL